MMMIWIISYSSLQRIRVHSDNILCVEPAETTKSGMYYVLQQLKQELPKVPIKVYQ